MAIEVKLQIEDDNNLTPEELMQAYEEAKQKAIYEKANEALANKKNKIIEALNNAEDNTVKLNASQRKLIIKMVNTYEFTDKEVHAEHVRLNPSLRKKRSKKQ